METQAIVVVLVSSLLTLVTVITNLIAGFVRERNRKRDQAWETAKEILLKTDAMNNIGHVGREEAESIITHFHYYYSNLRKVEADNFEQLLQERKARRLAEQGQPDYFD